MEEGGTKEQLWRKQKGGQEIEKAGTVGFVSREKEEGGGVFYWFLVNCFFLTQQS